MISQPAPRRVIFVNKYFYPDISATSRMLSGIVFELAQQGFAITVVTGQSAYQDPGQTWPASETVKGVEIIRVASSRFTRQNYLGRLADIGWFYIRAGSRLMSLVTEIDVLVCKSDPPMLIVLGTLIRRFKKCALVSWNQDLFPEVAHSLLQWYPARAVYTVLLALRNRALSRCEDIVVISQAMKNYLNTQIPARISVISNWSPALAPDPQRVAGLRRRWGLDNRFVITYSGNFGFVHEYQSVQDTIERLKGSTDVVFLFIGSGRFYQRLQEHVAKTGLANVVFQPYQPRAELANSLAVADIHLVTLKSGMQDVVMPSKFYGICAASRPVLFIGDDSCEIAQMIKQHECGYMANPGQVDEIVSILEKTKSSPEVSRNMAENARRLFEQNFTLDHAVKGWAKLLGAKA